MAQSRPLFVYLIFFRQHFTEKFFSLQHDLNTMHQQGVYKQSHLYQGRTNGYSFLLLACIHPVMSCRAGWIFHPSTSFGSFSSSKLAALCMQARIMWAHSFYLGIDDFVSNRYYPLIMKFVEEAGLVAKEEDSHSRGYVIESREIKDWHFPH